MNWLQKAFEPYHSILLRIRNHLIDRSLYICFILFASLHRSTVCARILFLFICLDLYYDACVCVCVYVRIFIRCVHLFTSSRLLLYAYHFLCFVLFCFQYYSFQYARFCRHAAYLFSFTLFIVYVSLSLFFTSWYGKQQQQEHINENAFGILYAVQNIF